jgi:hypothetical protein
MPGAWSRVRHSRTVHTVIAAEMFNCLPVYRLRVFESGVMVLQLLSHSEDVVVKETQNFVSRFILSGVLVYFTNGSLLILFGTAAPNIFVIWLHKLEIAGRNVCLRGDILYASGS